MVWIEFTVLSLALLFCIMMVVINVKKLVEVKRHSFSTSNDRKLTGVLIKLLFICAQSSYDKVTAMIVKEYSNNDNTLFEFVGGNKESTLEVLKLMQYYEQEWKDSRVIVLHTPSDLNKLAGVWIYDVVLFTNKGMALDDGIIELVESGQVKRVVVGYYE